jgi:1,2-diacylglycerol 3-alpha-glucosyltransferase
MYEDYLGYIFGGKLITPRTAAIITKILLNNIDGIVVPTKKVKKVIESYGIKCENHIIPTGINVDKFYRDISNIENNELLNKLGLNGDNKILVYFGRIAEEKNIQEIIFYLSKLKENKLQVKLLIVGGGPYLYKLKQYAFEQGVHEQVCFAGMIRPEEIYKYYQLGSIFVTASTSETQGLTYIEAMASGLPVVCRFDSCVEDLVLDGETGFTYNDENEFSIYVAKLLSDENFRSGIAKRARIKTEEYSSQTFGKKAEELYLKCSQRENAKIRRWFSVSAVKNKGLAS